MSNVHNSNDFPSDFKGGALNFRDFYLNFTGKMVGDVNLYFHEYLDDDEAEVEVIKNKINK